LDWTALENLATWCQQFSSLIGIESVSEPSSLLMDVTGSAPRLGGEQALAECVAAASEQQGYQTRVAIAATMGAAWALAHEATPPGTSFSAEFAIVPTEQTATRLIPLSIQALRLSADTVELLHQLGIRRIGQLLQLPRKSLSARFGNELLLRLDQACGRVPETIVAHSPAEPLQASWQLEYPTAKREIIEKMTQALTEQLSIRLQQQDREAVQIEYHLSPTSGAPTTICVGLYTATASARHFFDLLRMQLESQSLSGPIQQATLQATIAVARHDHQHRLFADSDSDSAAPASRQLAHLIERLSSRLGRERVVSARLSREPQIELAYRYHPLTDKLPAARHTRNQDQLTAYCRPLLLIHPPLALPAVSIAPDGPPVSFHYQSNTHQIIAHWGPERVETGWWRGPTIRRDYYRVEDQHGSRFWLFRDLRKSSWFLHGEFV
jgi:protein ImuB